MTDIMTPALGESVTEATVARWAKKAGEAVRKDEVLVELETDKVSLEVVAQEDGVLSEIAAEEGATVVPGTVLGRLNAGGAAAPAKAAPAPAPKAEKPPEPAPAPAAKPAPAAIPAAVAEALPLSPSVQRIVTENKLDPTAITGSGKDGRLTKGDALGAIEAAAAIPTPVPAPAPVAAEPRVLAAREERVRMTRLRQTIGRRLKEAQNTAAMLTTFNEVDMTNVMALRERMKDEFEKKHGARLGFMSFFVKACIAGLKELPAVNAEIEGEELVYKNYYDIGVAVGTPNGLVVPVLRDADALGFGGIEKGIADLGHKARDGKLTIADLTGGTFTISNGGVYGSLMSTPILNPP
ncbi:MAG TPA: 2-oxoglutarate dehydrogenase complex dihydrolipoyllysine-residue succinyltransferase, partial [Caulobacteraceae bacterium]